MKLGDTFPDFGAITDVGIVDSFHEWMGEGSWAILFSHPADFTPVCTTELARAAALADEFKMRNVKMIALSCDSVDSHRKWIFDICDVAGMKCDNFPFPIIADESRELAYKLEMLDPDEIGSDGKPLTARAVFIIGPKKTLKAMILYPATSGRSFDEILRLIDSLQLTEKKPVATPEGWNPGQQCMVQPSVSNDDATKLFGKDAISQKDVPSGKTYLRYVQP